jgi:uncharacterized protein
LRIYVLEWQKHRGQVLYDWLLNLARKCGLPRGAARCGPSLATEGTGCTTRRFLQEIEELLVHAEFVVEEQEARRLLEHVAAEGLRLVYTIPVP